jgi:hypothetical protein
VSGLRVVHEIPGRLRIRVPPDVDLPRLAEAVRTEPGVLSSTGSARTRGLLVLYEPESQSGEALKDALGRHSGLDVPYESPPPAAVATRRGRPGSAVAHALRRGVGEIDQHVHQATRGLVGLSGLLPLALSTWAVSQLLRGRVSALSWSSALWYAHALFRDYQAPAPPE